MQVPEGHVGEIWTDVLGWSSGEVTIGEDVSIPGSFHLNETDAWTMLRSTGLDRFQISRASASWVWQR